MKEYRMMKYFLAGALTLVLAFVCCGLIKVSAATNYPAVKIYARFNGDSTQYASSASVPDSTGTVNAYPIANRCSEAYMWNIWDSGCTITSISTYPTGFSDCVTLENNVVKVKTKAECQALHPDDFDDYISIGYVNFDIICNITLAKKAYPAVTFTVTIDNKEYTYSMPAGEAAKWPEVTKVQLLSGAKNNGKSISDLYSNVSLTKTTAANNSAYRYSNDTTSVCFGSDALTLAFTATGTLKSQGGDVTPTPEPEETYYVSFSVVTEDAQGSAEYFWKSSLSKTDDAAVTLDEILSSMKKIDPSTGEPGNEGIEDPSAWILNTNESPASSLTAEGYVKYTAADKSFKIAKKLDEDKDIAIFLAPAKLTINFTYVDYTSTFEVENGAKTKTKISYADIAAGLKREIGDEEYEYLDNYVITEIDGEKQTGKYSNSYYTVDNNVIRVEDFGNVSVEAKYAFWWEGYDPDTDSLVFESPVQLTIYWADVKKSAGAQLQGKAFKTLELKKPYKNVDYYKGSIPLNDKDNGVKIAENKTAYIYASIKAPAESKTKYSANYVVDATPYKKIAITFAYAWAAEGNEENSAIASVTTIGTNKKTTVYACNTDNDVYEIFDELQYSTDGETWYQITENEIGSDKINHDLNCDMLYKLTQSGLKTTLYFRMRGAEEVFAIDPEDEDDPKTPWFDESVGQAAANAHRASKPVKVSVDSSKDGKAVKMDVMAGTLALKNGYDITVTTKENDKPSLDEACSILPYNKSGKAREYIWDKDTKEIVEGDYTDVNYIYEFLPANKVTDNDKVFTNIKVKSISIERITDLCGGDCYGTGYMYIWVRKSATAKKPAENWTLMTIARITDPPVIAKVKGKDYFAAQDPADTKGVIAAPGIKNASNDKNSAAYEYLIVDASDTELTEMGWLNVNIDFTSAKWTAISEKGIIVGKSKSKYSAKTGVKAADHVLKEGSIILIRRSGDKNLGILASDYTITMVVKQDITYKDADNNDQTKSLFVWKEYSAE